MSDRLRSTATVASIDPSKISPGDKLQIAYHPASGRVLRILEKDRAYGLPISHKLFTVPVVGNETLLRDVAKDPSAFTVIDATTLEQRTETGPMQRAISTQYDDASATFFDELPSLDAALTYIDGISNLADAKAAFKKLVRVIYALARRMGLE